MPRVPCAASPLPADTYRHHESRNYPQKTRISKPILNNNVI